MFKLRGWILAFVIFMGTSVFAVENILVIPDNIVAKKSIQTIIYEDCAEFFAAEVINSLNKTPYIKAPTVTAVREKIKSNTRLTQSTDSAMKEFREGYNINYLNVKKLAQIFGVKKVMLITSSVDSRNYMVRRTVWDFLNIPGAAVVDPALKISTYAVLIDVNNDTAVWSNTYYKTISVVETRMVPLDYVQNTQQLEKIRDYSHSLAPNIAKNIQLSILPPSITSNRDNLIDDGFSVYDNELTKKYRKYKKNTSARCEEIKDNHNKRKEIRAEKRALKEAAQPKMTKQEKAEQKRVERQQKREDRADARFLKKVEKEKYKTEQKLKKEELKRKIQESNQQTIEEYYNKNADEVIKVKTNEPSLKDVIKDDAPEYIPVKPRLRDGFNSLETINDL